MAAPAPASPQEATTSQDKEIKPTANTASTEAVTSTNKPTNPTYLSIKHSPEYALAKSQLASGDMDTCLSLVETAISSLRPSLESADLHEAMAPLFYLYGTTLLYLVEENESMMNGGKVCVCSHMTVCCDAAAWFYLCSPFRCVFMHFCIAYCI